MLAGPPLAGPASVMLSARSWRGPFAAGRRIPLPPHRLVLVNVGAAPCTVQGVALDPARDGRTGLSADAAALHVSSETQTVPPGAPLVMTLDGAAPAHPGTYQSTLRVRTDLGAPLAVPVSLSVRAHPAWAILLMLAGLSLANALIGLATEGDVKAKLRDALRAREQAHEWVETHPLPDSRADDLAAMDRGFDQAITALDGRRTDRLVDHRVEDSVEPLRDAQDRIAALRKAASGQLPTTALVDDLARQWAGFQPQLAGFARPPAPGPRSSTPSLAERLDGLIGRVRARMLVAPALYISSELEAQLTRVRLAAAAGEVDRARLLVTAVQRWLRRAARQMATEQRLVALQQVQAATVLARDQALRRDVMADGIPDTVRQAVLARADAAEALLTDASDLPALLAVSRATNAASTDLARAAGQMQLARVQAAIHAASAETPFDVVNQATADAQADPDHSRANKIVRLRRIMALWQGEVAAARDVDARPALQARVDAVDAVLDGGDLSKLAMPYEALTRAWTAYGVRRMGEAAAAAQRPYCAAYADRLRNRAGALDQALRWQALGPLLDGWEQRLDAIQLDVDRVPAGGGCLGALLAIDSRSIRLGDQMLAHSIDTSAVSASARADAAALLGPDSAVSRLATLRVPRALTLSAETPRDERTVGRRIRFAAGNLDPDWGVGVMVTIDYGDGARETRTAEALRQTMLEHAYGKPSTFHPSIVAVQPHDAAGPALPPGAIPLGDGAATLLVAPAPDAAARKLTDLFLSARFGLALLIASVVYLWRFTARTTVFGERGFDYVEAFALGFAVNAAVAGLPAALARLAPG